MLSTRNKLDPSLARFRQFYFYFVGLSMAMVVAMYIYRSQDIEHAYKVDLFRLHSALRLCPQHAHFHVCEMSTFA